MAIQIWRNGTVGCEEAACAGSRERETDEASVCANSKLRDAAGCELQKAVTPDATRKAVTHLVEVHQVSPPQVYSALNLDRSTVRHQSRRSDDSSLRDAMKAFAKERHRFGYRRLHMMVERQGWQVNHKKFRRFYREEKPQLRSREGRRRALGTRRQRAVPHMGRTGLRPENSYLMRRPMAAASIS